ncbi:MAG: transglycosylase domain-containing protein [Muribaculaceae bacterium]|nr:transglycosylase domain-containing protein [Muribaculaceae bacterium]
MSKTKLNKAARARRNVAIVKKMWWGFGIVMGLILLLFILIYNGVIGYMPEIDQLKNPTDKFASTIYAAGGEEMGRYYRSKGNRVYVDFDQLSPHLKNALIATEDARFDAHSGIDVKAIGRAIIKRVLMGQKSAGGGSTITQQLAKQLYSPESSNIFERALQKPIEWVIAVKLERYYTKDEIIKMYFNQFDFLNNAVGIKTAAKVYFGKDPAKLDINESATLVGMCKNPSYYNPLRHNERTRERRSVVLDQMVKAGYLSEADCNPLKNQPLVLNYHRVDHNDGLAPYFREELRRVMMARKPNPKDYPSWNRQAYVDDSTAWVVNPLFGWCHKNKKPDGSDYDIYTDGLKIYTSIDARMQEYAEKAVKQHMSKTLQPAFLRERGGTKNPYTNNTQELSASAKQALINNAIKRSERYRVLKKAGKTEAEIMSNFRTPTEMRLFSYDGDFETTMSPLDSLLYTKSFLRCAMMSMDPVTGHVKAYVGGPDFRFFKYDMVSTGRRQIGSTVKPFVYSKAINDFGLTPCTMRPGGAPNIHWYREVWNPRGVGGTMTLKQALTHSTNSISAGFMRGTSPNWIEERGYPVYSPDELVKWMHSFGITSYLDPVPALSLGVSEITLREMVAAYSAFANGGMRVEPIYVTRICDNRGNVVAEFNPQQTEIMSEDTYLKMLSMLMSVVDSGTGHRLRYQYGITAEMGGKTGTTNFNSDGWFMGFTPELVTGVWVGGEERYIHFVSTAMGQGAEAALPILGLFMKSIYADPQLPYTQATKFVFPSDFRECGDELGWYGGGSGDGGEEYEGEEAVEGVFD